MCHDSTPILPINRLYEKKVTILEILPHIYSITANLAFLNRDLDYNMPSDAGGVFIYHYINPSLT